VRNMVKTGVYSGGAMEFIPRPDTIGMLLNGMLGKDVSAAVPAKAGAYKHTITMNTDPYDIPYFTAQHAPGGMWGDQLLDCRFTALGLSWKAANFLRGTLGLSGGMPSKITAPAGVTPDAGPQFLTVLSSIQLPTATDLKVLSGSFVIGNAIPLDEQWIVGSYSPDNFDVTSRAISISLVVKLTDGALYSKMMYDPAGGSTWVANLMKESDFKLQFKSDQNIASTDEPYSITVKAHATEKNVIWAADPVGVRAGRQVIMSITGVFLASADTLPVTVELVNAATAAY
jgi:hypothetical protein